MSRFIDAIKLKEELLYDIAGEKISPNRKITLAEVINSINAQPTVFDDKKILEKLEERKQKWIDGNYTDYADGIVDGLEEAIEIVKGGSRNGC